METEQMTLEQCKKLKEWGLPQGDCPQTYFEDKRGVTILADPVTVSDYFTGGEKEICACPDLEQLLEFANGKISDVLMLSPSSHFLSLDCPTGDVNWEVRYTTATGICAGDPDPKVAVYKLLEKILEAKA